MAGRKYGAVIAAKVKGSYFALPQADQDLPGAVMEEMMGKYAGKIDFLRRLWTSAFSAEVSDVFYIECDDLMDLHNWNQEFNQRLAQGGDPDRFGETVALYVGVNPDPE